MTREQITLWHDFAMRMARTCYATSRRPSMRWIVNRINDFFEGAHADELACIINWEHSTTFPEDSIYYGRASTATYCGCDGWRNKHGTPNPDCPECHGRGVHYALNRGGLACDMLTESLDGHRGYPPQCRACEEDDDDSECRCDDIEYNYYEQWADQWESPVHSCVRAGLDMLANRAGVLGFTCGDLRRMYPEGVPEWVCPADEELMIMGNGSAGYTFAGASDDMGIVL